MLHLPCQMLEAGPLSESIMNSKHAYSDSFLRKILTRNNVIVSVGVSLNAIRPSYFVARYLSRRGYTIIPVNPGYEGELLFGQRVYARMDQIEQPIDMVQVFRKSDAVPAIYEDALACWPAFKTIWMQIGVEHEATACKAQARGIDVVQDLCPKMEHQRLSGELGKYGVNTGLVRARLADVI